MKKAFVFVTVTLIAACGEPKVDIAAEVLASPVFNASELGMTVTQIQAMYPTAQPDGAGGLLFDTTYADGTTLSIGFTFENDALTALQADLAPQHQNLSDTINARLSRSLSMRFGKASAEGDYLSWQSPQGLADVADESALYKSPHLSFTLYGFNR